MRVLDAVVLAPAAEMGDGRQDDDHKPNLSLAGLAIHLPAEGSEFPPGSRRSRFRRELCSSMSLPWVGTPNKSRPEIGGEASLLPLNSRLAPRSVQPADSR